jgi:tetratricopeptide (TPR) repeat protein
MSHQPVRTIRHDRSPAAAQRKSAAISPLRYSVKSPLGLQRVIGNQAVMRLLNTDSLQRQSIPQGAPANANAAQSQSDPTSLNQIVETSGASAEELARDYFDRGGAAYSRRNYGRAAQYYVRASEMLGNSRAAILWNIGKCNYKLGRWLIAADYFQQSLRGLDTEYVEETGGKIRECQQRAGVPMDENGVIMLGSDDASRAEGNRDLQRATGYYENGQFSQAMNIYLELYTRSNRGDMAFNVAQCNRRMGRHATALNFYRRFLELSPNSEYRGEAEQRIRDAQAALGLRPDGNAA